MTGWRVGWMVVPEALVRSVERLAQNLYISPPAIAQAAALGAFDAGEELEANRSALRRQPRAAAGGAAEGGLCDVRARRRRLLPLLRCQRHDRRRGSAGAAPAGRGGRGGDAGHRLRRGARQPVPALLLRRERRPTWPRRRGACRPGPGVAANPFVTGRARAATDCRRPRVLLPNSGAPDNAAAKRIQE